MRYHLIPPERDNYCVCSVIQGIFKSHGINLSQEEIAGRLTPSEHGFLVDDEKMKELMLEMGFSYSYFPHNATPFNEPDMLLGDMNENQGFLGINPHAYLLGGFNDPELTLIDPLDCSRNKRDIYGVLREMQQKGGGFGLIKKLN